MPDDVSIFDVLEELCGTDPVIWTMVKRRLKRLPLTFDMSKIIDGGNAEKDVLLRHRPFLIQPLRDNAQHKVYIKSRQVGASELHITEVLHFLDVNGPDRKWLYTFPREKQLLDFSNTRILPAFKESPLMEALIGVPNQTFMKRIHDSFLLLRSTWESNLGEGIDADGVTLDEKDRMKVGVDVAFKESLKSSKFGYIRELSTPTLPGRGIDEVWLKSDQMIWHVRCTKCGLRQPIDYPDNFVQMKDYPLGATELPEGAWEYACRRLNCRGPLDRVHGEWIPTYPDRRLIRGYHVSQLMCMWISATTVMQQKITYKFIQPWTNYVLGKISQGDSILVTDQDFQACYSSYQFFNRRTPDWVKISVGIDWGTQNWFVVMGLNAHNLKRYILAIGIIDDDPHDSLNMRDVINFLTPFAPDVIIADAGYGKDRNAKLLKHFDPNHEGRFFAQWYNPSETTSRTFQPVWGEARVLVDRTIMLKSLCRAVKEREFGMPGGLAKIELLQKHIKALTPLKELDEDTGEMKERIEATGPDHLAHACASAHLGMDKLTERASFAFDFI